MCCKSFWKKIVLFSLAFGFSVFISDTFFPNQQSLENEQQITDTSSKKKNCVPVDKSLKYQTLPLEETYWSERDIEGLVLIPQALKNKGKEVKNKKESSTDVQNSQTNSIKIK